MPSTVIRWKSTREQVEQNSELTAAIAVLRANWKPNKKEQKQSELDAAGEHLLPIGVRTSSDSAAAAPTLSSFGTH